MSPTLLYLVTAVLQAAATKAADSSEILADSPPVLAALDGLQALVSMRLVMYRSVGRGTEWQCFGFGLTEAGSGSRHFSATG